MWEEKKGFVHLDGPDNVMVRRRRARQCMAVKRPAECAAIGKVGVG